MSADNVYLSNTQTLEKYMKLDQKGKVLAEYVWIDGSNGMRNKTKVSPLYYSQTRRHAQQFPGCGMTKSACQTWRSNADPISSQKRLRDRPKPLPRNKSIGSPAAAFLAQRKQPCDDTPFRRHRNIVANALPSLVR